MVMEVTRPTRVLKTTSPEKGENKDQKEEVTKAKGYES